MPSVYGTTQQPEVEGAVYENGVTEELVPPEPIVILPGDCLHDLFSKYSTDGRVDPNGFVKLLQSLGLGEDSVIPDSVIPERNEGDRTQYLFADHAQKKRSVTSTTSDENNGKSLTTEATPISKPSSDAVTDESVTRNVSPVTNHTLDHGIHTDHHQSNYHVTEVRIHFLYSIFLVKTCKNEHFGNVHLLNICVQ